MFKNHETYARGQEKQYDIASYSRRIFEMAEKPGYIAKEIEFSDIHDPNLKTFEDFKKSFIKNSELHDKYLADFLPNYYYTFDEEGSHEEKRKAIFFMQEVSREPGLENAPKSDLMRLIFKCVSMFRESYDTSSNTGLFIDLRRPNIKYGTVIDSEAPKLYLVDLYPLANISHQDVAYQISSFARSCNLYGDYEDEINNLILELRKLSNVHT